eukprot:COSAG06_NODE_53780_length_298_cov_0.733668_1_plen_36_part_10
MPSGAVYLQHLHTRTRTRTHTSTHALQAMPECKVDP